MSKSSHKLSRKSAPGVILITRHTYSTSSCDTYATETIQFKEEYINGESSASSSAIITGSPAHEDSSGEPPANIFCHLSRILEKNLKEGVKKA